MMRVDLPEPVWAVCMMEHFLYKKPSAIHSKDSCGLSSNSSSESPKKGSLISGMEFRHFRRASLIKWPG